MKTFLLDIIPSIQRYSQKLDNLTLLNNQHWVSIDTITTNKIVYIFKADNRLLIAINGRVKKAKWEYLGIDSLLIEIGEESYLFRHGFFDANILALKPDSTEEYAIFLNQNKYSGELNSIEAITAFLQRNYLPSSKKILSPAPKPMGTFNTDKGEIEVELNFRGAVPAMNNKVFQHNTMAADGKYRLGFLNYITVRNGIVVDLSMS